jgi:hypothetical protein
LADQKYHILPALHAGLDAVEIVLAADRLFVDLEDDVSAGHPDVVGE